ncbi:hypothetical protein [Streptomyces sp. NBC_00996]|uniref:hypothetical protein n=1 Tax=Streptomyces sp. NBC_00996 TaxID=2903710 RepID=UPI003864DA5E|nr:hypothetical protein OG390_31600 [Streptomyces sp. NBC_00996]
MRERVHCHAEGRCEGGTEKFTKVAAEKASGTGDESVAFAATGDADGDDVVVHAEVIRHGNTIATYYAFSLAAFSGEDGADAGDYDIPAEIIKGQAAKLA